MTEQWDNWRRRLAGDKTVPTYETEPDSGYYREAVTVRTQGGATKKIGWIPIVYWRDDSGLRCYFGAGDERRLLNEADAVGHWLWVVKYPITEEQYRAVAERGERWHDEPQTSAPAEATIPAANREVTTGDNQPPPVDPVEEMREQIKNAVGASKDIKVTTDEEAQRAQGSRARLLELSNAADRAREEEKRPHFEKAKAVDKKYMPLVTEAKDAADRIRGLLSAHETEKRRVAAEAQRKADLERQRIEEENRKAAAAAKRKGEEAPAPKEAPAPAATPAPASKIGGTYGKAAGVQTVRRAVIEDMAKVLTHYSKHPDLLIAVQKLANADVKAGITPPGVKVEEEADVR